MMIDWKFHFINILALYLAMSSKCAVDGTSSIGGTMNSNGKLQYSEENLSHFHLNSLREAESFLRS